MSRIRDTHDYINNRRQVWWRDKVAKRYAQVNSYQTYKLRGKLMTMLVETVLGYYLAIQEGRKETMI